MTVKIIVRRHYTKEIEPFVLPLLKQLFDQITLHGGCISGETLISTENPDEHLIVSTWSTMQEWMRYNNCGEVIDIRSKIDMITGEETLRKVYITDKTAHVIYNPHNEKEGKAYGSV